MITLALGSFVFALVLQLVLEEFSVAFPDIPMHAFCGEESFRIGRQHGLHKIPGVEARLPGSSVLGTPVGDEDWERQ